MTEVRAHLYVARLAAKSAVQAAGDVISAGAGHNASHCYAWSALREQHSQSASPAAACRGRHVEVRGFATRDQRSEAGFSYRSAYIMEAIRDISAG